MENSEKGAIKDFGANLMISIDFAANLGLSEFGARMGKDPRKDLEKSIRDDKNTKTLMGNTVAGTRTNTTSIQNLSVPQNVGFGFSDFGFSDFGFSDFPQNPDHFFFENHQKYVNKKSSISYQNPDESGRSLD